MRVHFIQDFYDLLRGKKTTAGGKISKSDINVNKECLSELFDKFACEEVLVNGVKRKFLLDVNADRGVTEQTLALLCSNTSKERAEVKVLNVGCGRKGQMDFLRTLGYDAYGVDFDIESDTNKIKFHDLNTQDDLPFDKGFFDVIICQEIIEHIENPWLLMRKIKKVLSPTGLVILTVPNICSLASRKTFYRSNYGYFTFYDPSNLWQHINPLPYWEIMHIANYNGLALKRITGSEECYVKFKAKYRKPTKELERTLTIQNNKVLHYVFSKINEEIKLYSPAPTHGYEWNKGDAC